MNLNNLPKITTKSSKRVGRGLASGKGKTAGRGTKGQKSRSGYNLPRRFEGGQTALIQRLPKVRGFRSRYAKPLTLDITHIEAKFEAGDEVNFKTLISKGLIKNASLRVKIVGAKLSKNLKFSDVVLTKKLLAEYKEQLAKPKSTPAKKPTTKKPPSKSANPKKLSVK